MNNGAEHRKLAAIMFTDMVGYTALTQRNEKLALELLRNIGGCCVAVSQVQWTRDRDQPAMGLSLPSFSLPFFQLSPVQTKRRIDRRRLRSDQNRRM